MELKPHIYFSKVMHKRLMPKVNQFTYGVYYLAIPLADIHALEDGWRFAVNRRGVLSFHESDHGPKDKSPLLPWIKNVLNTYKIDDVTDDITLITMPRVLGYAFNPVSFWLCYNEQKQLKAVLCEVNNTFGETHSYLCMHQNRQPIDSHDWLEAEKLFHVSPLLKREGHYKFRFAHQGNKLGIWIDYYNKDQEKQLITALTGTLHPYNRKNRSKAIRRHPLVTLKTIGLIHWQAIKLVTKGIKYIVKPQQHPQRLSTSGKLTKM